MDKNIINLYFNTHNKYATYIFFYIFWETPEDFRYALKQHVLPLQTQKPLVRIVNKAYEIDAKYLPVGSMTLVKSHVYIFRLNGPV